MFLANVSDDGAAGRSGGDAAPSASEAPETGKEESEEEKIARTLFVRGLPPSARRPEMRLALEAAAAAGASIASGASTDAAAAAAALVRAMPTSMKRAWRVRAVRVVGGQGGTTAFAEFADPRGADWALQAPPAEVRVDSVPVKLARALSGDDARRVATRRAEAAKSTKRLREAPVDADTSYVDPTDRRRLKLLEEGLIARDMPAAEGVCEHDLALRERLEEEKKL